MGWYIAGAVALAAVGGYAAGHGGKGATPTAPPPQPAQQAPKAPDANAVAAGQSGTGQAGGAPGVAQTFLTGPGGIDPSLLQLGKNTLLGGGTGSTTGAPGG